MNSPGANIGRDDSLSNEDLSRDEISRQTDRILTSRHFARSSQLRDLLEFILKHSTSLDRSEPLKEYSIAVEVFGRDKSFDPNSDSIVRVEMRRLRTKLANYYDNEGVTDPILIEAPKGSYTALIRRRGVADAVDLSGRVIAHYRLLQCVHRNRWHSAYEAECANSNRAVTVLLASRAIVDDPKRKERLLHDARISAGMDHPNVAPIFDIEDTSTGLFVVEGRTKAPTLAQRVFVSPLMPSETLDFARQLMSGISAGHRLGIAHGDLRPDTVSVEHDPTSGVVKRVRITSFVRSSLMRPDDSQAIDPAEDIRSFADLVLYSSGAAVHADEERDQIQSVPSQVSESLRRMLIQTIHHGNDVSDMRLIVTALEESCRPMGVSPSHGKSRWTIQLSRPAQILAGALILVALIAIAFVLIGPQ